VTRNAAAIPNAPDRNAWPISFPTVCRLTILEYPMPTNPGDSRRASLFAKAVRREAASGFPLSVVAFEA